jgi:hypothetical protein
LKKGLQIWNISSDNKFKKNRKLVLDKEERKPYIIRAFNLAFLLTAERLNNCRIDHELGFSLACREKQFFELKSGAIVIEPICHFQTQLSARKSAYNRRV